MFKLVFYLRTRLKSLLIILYTLFFLPMHTHVSAIHMQAQEHKVRNTSVSLKHDVELNCLTYILCRERYLEPPVVCSIPLHLKYNRSLHGRGMQRWWYCYTIASLCLMNVLLWCWMSSTTTPLYICSISSRRRTLAMERKHTTYGIGGGDDGTE